MVVTLPVLIIFFKETKGMSLEEIDLMFGGRALGTLPSDLEKTVAEKNAVGHHEEPATEKTAMA